MDTFVCLLTLSMIVPFSGTVVLLLLHGEIVFFVGIVMVLHYRQVGEGMLNST